MSLFGTILTTGENSMLTTISSCQHKVDLVRALTVVYFKQRLGAAHPNAGWNSHIKLKKVAAVTGLRYTWFKPVILRTHYNVSTVSWSQKRVQNDNIHSLILDVHVFKVWHLKIPFSVELCKPINNLRNKHRFKAKFKLRKISKSKLFYLMIFPKSPD